jgi:hypothetical protein
MTEHEAELEGTWRVYATAPPPTFRHSRRAAYRLARALNRRGQSATVYRWENGDWVLHERIDPK